MLLNLLFFFGGLAALVVGADALVRGASKLALSLGLSSLVVGLTVVAFGTSAPELAVSVGAVLDGRTDIAVGNVVGSNILNVLLILGVSALIVPLLVHTQVIRQEVPIMIGVTLLLCVLILDGGLSVFEGVLLFGLLLVYTSFVIRQSRRETQAARAEFDAEVQPAAPGAWDSRLGVQIGLIVVGLVLLVIGARGIVTAAVAFAQALGVSELVIGLTIVAIGTSLPEIAASIVAAIKGERDIAVGNIVGSNIFNILSVLGLSAIVAGGAGLTISSAVLNFDMWIMLAVAVACLPVFFSGREIARWEGGVFVAYYVAYVAFLILQAQQHAVLEAYSTVMMLFVVPLTIITLVVTSIRRH
jgi:cation:H+ antiporter